MMTEAAPPCGWEWELSKQRGLLNYERRTHFHSRLLKLCGANQDGKKGIREPPGENVYPLLGYGSKYARRGKNSREECMDDCELHSQLFGINQRDSPRKGIHASHGRLVFTPKKGNEIVWGRRGRKGYKFDSYFLEDGDDDDMESSDEEDEIYYTERWPEPAKHKGGRPYNKPVHYSGRRLFLDKRVLTKGIKRQEWHQEIIDDDSRYFYKGKGQEQISCKISVIESVTSRHKSIRAKQRVKYKPGIHYIETIRAQRKRTREARENLEVVPPFLESSLNTDSAVLAITDNEVGCELVGNANIETQSNSAPLKVDNPVSNVPKEVSKGVTADTFEEDGILQIKLPREATRPDTLHMEFRHDYREAGCKPRRFVLNISRIVIHHVTLMNRLRLRTIPKLDLTTYLVFAYCRESTPGVDLYRVWVVSTWAGSGRDIFVPFNSSGENVAQIQELIQCVVSAIDTIDLRRLITKTNRRNKKNIHFDYRPATNFSMLHSVMQWEFNTTSVPRASEWFLYDDAGSTSHNLHGIHGLDKIFKPTRDNQNVGIVRHGPSNPDLCGACLVGSDINGHNRLLALGACSHWFCEQCWKSRLLRQLKKADSSPEALARCVEDGCKNPVDSVTLLTLLSVEKIRSIVDGKMRNDVISLAPSVVICPNDTCRQIFTIFTGTNTNTSDVAIPIVCRCSCQFCSKCRNSPHWPALCDFSVRYKELTKQRKDNALFSRMLLDAEFPEDLLCGRKCFNCGRFVRQFVFRKTEPNEFGRPLCLQCAKEDHKNNNVHKSILSNSNRAENGQTTSAFVQNMQNITKWYKIANTHRKMRHPEVIKALYVMAETVADKLVCAVTADKYVGDAKKAAAEWDDLLFEWAEENYKELCTAQVDTKSSNEDSGVSSSGKHRSSESMEASSRATSASSRYSSQSLSHFTDNTSLDFSVGTSRFSAPLNNEKSEVSVEMTRAACNIVQLKLELHQIAEYLAVLLDYQVALRGKLIRCLERAEDLCFSLGILLQDPHVHNAGRILPTFMRLRVQAKHAIENIHREIANVGVTTELEHK